MRTRVPARGRLSSKPSNSSRRNASENRQKTHAELGGDFAPGDHLADSYFAAQNAAAQNALANDNVSFTSEVGSAGRAVFHKMLNLIHPSTACMHAGSFRYTGREPLP